MPFAEYTDGANVTKAVRWDGTDAVAEEAIEQIPGISVHINTVGETVIKELRFADFLTVPEGDWLAIFVDADSVTAHRFADAEFTSTFEPV